MQNIFHVSQFVSICGSLISRFSSIVSSFIFQVARLFFWLVSQLFPTSVIFFHMSSLSCACGFQCSPSSWPSLFSSLVLLAKRGPSLETTGEAFSLVNIFRLLVWVPRIPHSWTWLFPKGKLVDIHVWVPRSHRFLMQFGSRCGLMIHKALNIILQEIFVFWPWPFY